MKSLTAILLFITFQSFGQMPCFSTSPVSNCVGETFTMINCSSNTETPQYSYDNGLFDTISTFVFNQTGNHMIIQGLHIGSTAFFDTVFVTVKSKPIPVFEVALCNNFGVQIVIPDSGYSEYIVTWGDGQTNTYNGADIATHSFLNNNTRTITMEGKHQPENCGAAPYTTTTNPVATILKAEINILEVIGNDTIILTITGQKNVIYDINLYSGSSTFIKKHTLNAQNNSFNDTITGLNTVTTTYCIDIKSYDACTGLVNNTSDKICSVVLSATAIIGQNTISWEAYIGDRFIDFDLLKNTASIFQSNVNSKNENWDRKVFCNQEYNYKLVTNLTNGGKSISNISSVIGQSEKSPKAVTNVYSTFNENNKLVISWTDGLTVPPLNYTINNIKTTNKPYIIDEIKRKCYQITYTDSCGNTSQISEETCPVIIEAEQNNIFEIGLNWNEYSSFIKGLENYVLKIYDINNQLIKTENMNFELEYLFDVTNETNQIYYFLIEGNSVDSLTTFSNKLRFELDNRIRIPNAFSPNGDGQNDIFIPKVRFINEFKMFIYNQWGQNLFTSTDSNNGWKGDDSPSGVYTYVIEITDYLGNKTSRKGTVTLVK